MAGNEDEFAVLRPRFAEFQPVLHLDWFAVLVSAKEANIEIEARKLKVIGVASEEAMACSGAITSRTSVNFL